MRAPNVRAVLEAAVDGRFPVADGTVEVIPEAPGKAAAVLVFTAHSFVCAPVSPGWVRGQLPAGDLSAPLGAPFLLALADRIGARIGAVDAVLAQRADGRTPSVELRPLDEDEHPRVRRARRYRSDVQVWGTSEGGGHVVLGRGVAGRWEASFEVAPGSRGHRSGRLLAESALALVPSGTAVFVQVAPGNAASLRTVLAAGYRPIGGEVLLPPRNAQ